MKELRRLLGQRLRALRRQKGLSQERLGKGSVLSGKFIGEVERGEKSISLDSLYRMSVALEIPLKDLVNLRPGKGLVSSKEGAELFALLAQRRKLGEIRRALEVLRAVFRDV